MVGVGLYVKNSAEAVEFYKKVFGLELGYHVKNPDGSYFHSELNKDGEAVLSVVEAKNETRRESIVHLGMEMEDEAAVKKAYELLCEGGTIEMPIGPLPWSPCSAEVTDRFGVLWYISAPQHRPPEEFDQAVTAGLIE